jgi:iron(III) transport system substrate-binding protein
MLFPNAADRGTHVNISGAAVAANAPHRDNAVKLLEFMVTQEAQEIYAEGNGEYPVTANAHASDLVKSWGELKPDAIPLSQIAALRKKASELVDKVRFDAGPNS